MAAQQLRLRPDHVQQLQQCQRPRSATAPTATTFRAAHSTSTSHRSNSEKQGSAVSPSPGLTQTWILGALKQGLRPHSELPTHRRPLTAKLRETRRGRVSRDCEGTYVIMSQVYVSVRGNAGSQQGSAPTAGPHGSWYCNTPSLSSRFRPNGNPGSIQHVTAVRFLRLRCRPRASSQESAVTSHHPWLDWVPPSSLFGLCRVATTHWRLPFTGIS